MPAGVIAMTKVWNDNAMNKEAWATKYATEEIKFWLCNSKISGCEIIKVELVKNDYLKINNNK